MEKLAGTAVPETFGAPFEGAGKTGHRIRLYSECSIFWGAFSLAQKKVGFVQPFLIFFPPNGYPREGKDYVATLILPHSGDPKKARVT